MAEKALCLGLLVLVCFAGAASASPARKLKQTCSILCDVADGSKQYCCPDGFNCFSSSSFTCYPASSTYPSEGTLNGYAPGSSATGTPGPTTTGTSTPAATSTSAPGGGGGVVVGPTTCPSASYPSVCATSSGTKQYCCQAGYACFSGPGLTCYKQDATGTYPSSPAPDGSYKVAVPGLAFDCSKIIEITIDQIQDMFAAGTLDSVTLVSCYLQRIADYDSLTTFTGKTAYATNAILEINPSILADAAAKDAERAACAPNCKLDKLHGIPAVLKDNVCAVGMECTAGAWNLVGSRRSDAFLVSGIKKAGGIILAKAGLSEWANYRGSSVSGWSGRGGQVYNPYNRYQITNITVAVSPYAGIPSALPNGTYTNIQNPSIVSGSSSGSAVTAATSLATITIGSETSGSILGPSSSNGIVGIKPTVGLVSRAGVVPLSSSQDTAGPMCRSVTDAVYLLDAIIGIDSDDADTAAQQVPAGGYTQFLKKDGLSGKKLVAITQPSGTDANVLAAYTSAISFFQSSGATVTMLPSNFTFPGTALDSSAILPTDFKADIADFMAGLTWLPGYTPMKTLADLIQYNKDNYLIEFQGGSCCRGNPAYGNFWQQTWETAQNTTGKSSAAYLTAKANVASQLSQFTAFMAAGGYDAFISTGAQNGQFARMRLPGITLPLAKLTTGRPQGLYIQGLAWTEPTLITIAYAFEQGFNKGVRPFAPTYCDAQC